jgi:hypothetical protein
MPIKEGESVKRKSKIQLVNVKTPLNCFYQVSKDEFLVLKLESLSLFPSLATLSLFLSSEFLSLWSITFKVFRQKLTLRRETHFD